MLAHYHRTNSLQANPDKTKVTAFHLRNKKATQSLKIKWNNSDLENTDYPNYLSVIQDRTLSYKETYKNKDEGGSTRNNFLRKLANSKWGTNASTIRTTTLALCCSVAKYANPVWLISKHAHLLNLELNQTCKVITGYIKPTNVVDL